MMILHVLILISVRGAGGRYAGPQEQWNTPTSVPSQWGGAGGVAYRPHFFKPTPASLGMQPHVRHAHVLSQQGSPQQQQGVNSSWISEMEIRRRSELNQMMIAEKERQRQLVQRVRYYMYMYMYMYMYCTTLLLLFIFLFLV